MRIRANKKEAEINTLSNWPLVLDLFFKWGYPETLLHAAKMDDNISVKVEDFDKVTSELGMWGIPWKRVK